MHEIVLELCVQLPQIQFATEKLNKRHSIWTVLSLHISIKRVVHKRTRNHRQQQTDIRIKGPPLIQSVSVKSLHSTSTCHSLEDYVLPLASCILLQCGIFSALFAFYQRYLSIYIQCCFVVIWGSLVCFGYIQAQKGFL